MCDGTVLRQVGQVPYQVPYLSRTVQLMGRHGMELWKPTYELLLHIMNFLLSRRKFMSLTLASAYGKQTTQVPGFPRIQVHPTRALPYGPAVNTIPIELYTTCKVIRVTPGHRIEPGPTVHLMSRSPGHAISGQTVA